MTSFTTMNARKEFAELINRASYGKERILISRRGKNIAAVVPIEDVELLAKIEELQDIQDAEKALRDVKKRGTVPLDKIRKRLGL